jgi:hypothetical protein
MAIYTFINKQEIEEEHWMNISDLDQFKIDNPDLKQIIGGFGGFVAGKTGVKADEGFRDILREIKRVNPGSTIDVV